MRVIAAIAAISLLVGACEVSSSTPKPRPVAKTATDPVTKSLTKLVDTIGKDEALVEWCQTDRDQHHRIVPRCKNVYTNPPSVEGIK